MLTFGEMKFLLEETKNRLLNLPFCGAFELDLGKWILSFDSQGKKVFFLICIKPPFSRFHLSFEKFEPKKASSSFTGMLMKHLRETRLSSIELLNNDRILSLEFSRDKTTYLIVFELFSRGENAYLLGSANNVLASYKEVSFLEYKAPKNLHPSDLTPTSCSSKELEQKYLLLEKTKNFDEEKTDVIKEVTAKLKKSEKLYLHHKEEEEEGKRYAEVAHEAELLKAEFSKLKKGMAEIEVADYLQEGKFKKIILDPRLMPKDQLNRFFRLSKKLKKKLDAQGPFLKTALEEKQKWDQYLEEAEKISTLHELEAFRQKNSSLLPSIAKVKPIIKERSPFREFVTEKGLMIYAGKTDRDNEKLTFSFANGSDIWLHAANYPGSHVVLKGKKNEEIDQESLMDALQIALYYSKAKDAKEEEVTVTECKYISKAKGSKPGTVNVSKHKVLRVRLDENRLKRLFSQK